ncbi:MAG: hypothetical protein ACLTEU_12320 [Roseburia inulinivorans]
MTRCFLMDFLYHVDTTLASDEYGSFYLASDNYSPVYDSTNNGKRVLRLVNDGNGFFCDKDGLMTLLQVLAGTMKTDR